MENSLLQTPPADASPGWWSGSFSPLFRKPIASQIRLARKFYEFLPSHHRTDGNANFVDRLVSRYTLAGAVVHGMGGGKKLWSAGIHHGAVEGDIGCVCTVKRSVAPGLALPALAAWSCSPVLYGVNACHRHRRLSIPPFEAAGGAECHN